MKKWREPKLQIYNLKEVAREIFVNARSIGGCSLCIFCDWGKN